MPAGLKIVIGTRGSELALAQARLVREALQTAHPDLQVETSIISTTGDRARIPDQRAGWKGLFTAEIEKALLAGKIDMAVHSAKDLPSQIDPGAKIASVLPRANIHDVLVSKHPGALEGLPAKAIVGTSSVRRVHQLKWQRPNVSITDLRGNVPTRLRKLAENDWDGIVLAKAGLDRLGLSSLDFSIEPLPQDVFLPAGGQGIIAIQIRSDDATTEQLVESVNHDTTMQCLRAEREFLRLLNVDCNAPVGVLSTVEDGLMKMRAQFFRETSAAPLQGAVEGSELEPHALAGRLAQQLRLQS